MGEISGGFKGGGEGLPFPIDQMRLKRTENFARKCIILPEIKKKFSWPLPQTLPGLYPSAHYSKFLDLPLGEIPPITTSFNAAVSSSLRKFSAGPMSKDAVISVIRGNAALE